MIILCQDTVTISLTMILILILLVPAAVAIQLMLEHWSNDVFSQYTQKPTFNLKDKMVFCLPPSLDFPPSLNTSHSLENSSKNLSHSSHSLLLVFPAFKHFSCSEQQINPQINPSARALITGYQELLFLGFSDTLAESYPYNYIYNCFECITCSRKMTGKMVLKCELLFT